MLIDPKKHQSAQKNRGISLRSAASKLYQINFLQRMIDGLETLLRDNQCGFRKNRSCIDQIYTLRFITRKSLEQNLQLYINVVDFKAALVLLTPLIGISSGKRSANTSKFGKRFS